MRSTAQTAFRKKLANDWMRGISVAGNKSFD
jgi:hypothetical protein